MANLILKCWTHSCVLYCSIKPVDDETDEKQSYAWHYFLIVVKVWRSSSRSDSCLKPLSQTRPLASTRAANKLQEAWLSHFQLKSIVFHPNSSLLNVKHPESWLSVVVFPCVLLPADMNEAEPRIGKSILISSGEGKPGCFSRHSIFRKWWKAEAS